MFFLYLGPILLLSQIDILLLQGGVVSMRHRYNATMREKKDLKANSKHALAELKVAQDDLGKTVAQFGDAASKAERLEAYNSRLGALLTVRETKLMISQRNGGVEGLQAFGLRED